MATLACSNCPKTFKTQNGLTWHLAHAHLSPVVESPPRVQEILVATYEGEAKGLPDMADLTKDKLEALLHETLKRAEELQVSHGLDSESAESMQDDLSRIGERVKELEACTGCLTALRSEVKSQESGIASLKRQLAERDAVIASLCRLVLKLDTDHKERHTFADLAVDRSEATVNEARSILLGFLPPVLLTR